MYRQRFKKDLIDAKTLVLAVILFMSVVIMSYGFFRLDSLILCVGLFISIVTILIMIFQVVISSQTDQITCAMRRKIR